MEIKKLNRQEIESIYYNQMQIDFPPEEIRPWAMFLRSFSMGLYTGYGLFDGEKLLSYATFTFAKDNGGAVLLDYYAVDASLRGKGIGREFLTQLSKMLNDISLILLEVENPSFAKNSQDLSLRTRRIGFYERCGAVLSPITSKVFDADFSIMYLSKEGEKSRNEIISALRGIYSAMFEKDILDKHIKIFP